MGGGGEKFGGGGEKNLVGASLLGEFFQVGEGGNQQIFGWPGGDLPPSP